MIEVRDVAELRLPVTTAKELRLAPHQGAVKTDQTIGTMVVPLPSRSIGGGRVVALRGESIRHRGSASSLMFVALYAAMRQEDAANRGV